MDPLRVTAVLELGILVQSQDPSVDAPPQASVVLDPVRVSKKELSWFTREFFADWRWSSD